MASERSVTSASNVVSIHQGDVSSLETKPPQSKSTRRYQLHVRISEREYALLKDLAGKEDQPMTQVVRRMIRQWLHDMQNRAR